MEAARNAIMLSAGLVRHPGQRWSDLALLRNWTSLPIVVKACAIRTTRAPRYARAAGVVVSNHGERQVDRAIAALDQLPSVANAVGEEMTVLFDSAIGCGADVLIALALGADAVLVGRPYVYGLALGGEAGVEHVLRRCSAIWMRLLHSRDTVWCASSTAEHSPRFI